MSESDALDRAAFDAFTLAVRVILQAYELDPPASEYERPWQLLREIANGETTLATTADLAARFPAMRDFLYERANQVVENDRAVARRVLRGLGSAF
jgi:hypothetical protein